MADKIQMPASTGGIVRYSEEYGSKLVLKPEFVVGAIVVVIVAAIILGIFL